MGDTGPERHPVAAAGEYDPAATTLDQLKLATDTDAERHQTALQALAAVDPDQAHLLADPHLAERQQIGHRAALLIMIRIL